MNTYKCLECGSETASQTGLCDACQKRHALVEKLFQDFMCNQRGTQTTKEKHYNSEVKHWEYPTKEEAEAAGCIVPTWRDEMIRFLKCLQLKKITNRNEYFHLLHRACAWRDATFPNYVLMITTYFFNGEWLDVVWYDYGQKELKKHGKIVQRYRRPGWRRTVYNPYEYIKWAHKGMTTWLTKMLREKGLTRKDLVRMADETILKEGGYPDGKTDLW